MGKRELLLVLGLVVAGAAVYHATAPPAVAGQENFSVARLIEVVRRHVRGNRATAETTTTAVFPVSPATKELRLAVRFEGLTITGEERDDIASELRVWSNGYDDQEAQRLTTRTVLKANQAGGRIAFTIDYPPEARQRAWLELRVPKRLSVNVARYNGKLSIANTGDVELVETRGEVTIRDLSGGLSASHRGGDLTIADVDSLKLNVRGSDVRLTRVRGDATIQAQAGELRGTEIGGAIAIESNGTDVVIETPATARAPIHVTATNGSVTLNGVRSETRIDGRNAEIEVTLERAATLVVYSEGDEPIEIGTPRGGYELDAATSSGGEIRLPDGLPEVTEEGGERRVAGAVQGGGPTMTLRATNGDIVLRSPDAPRRTAPALPAEAPEPPAPPKPPKTDR